MRPRLYFLLLIWKPKWLAWWLAGKEKASLTSDTNSPKGILLAEEEPLGYKPFGIPEPALPAKTRAVYAHEYASALVFSEGVWLCPKGLAQLGLKHSSESKTIHGFFVLKSRLKRRIHRRERGVLLYNRWSMNNYYHWMTETVPRLRLWMAHPEAPITPILLPKSFPDFCIESIKLMAPQLPVFRLSGEEELVLVKRFFFISEPWADIPSSGLLKKSIRALYANIETNRPAPTKFVFALRRPGLSRSILNVAEVKEALAEIPVNYVDFDELAFRDQLVVVRNSIGLIGFHGANLTNLMFLPAGGQVVEISFPFLQAAPWNRFCYQHLAQACGLDYTLFLEANTTEESMDGPVWLDGQQLSFLLASKVQDA